jgi:hypothetical protein
MTFPTFCNVLSTDPASASSPAARMNGGNGGGGGGGGASVFTVALICRIVTPLRAPFSPFHF